MSNPAMPQFFATPQTAWIACESARAVGSEIVCSVARILGGTSVIVTSIKFARPDLSKIQGVVIGSLPEGGRLVDFPSGDRVAVPESKIEIVNGSSV